MPSSLLEHTYCREVQWSSSLIDGYLCFAAEKLDPRAAVGGRLVNGNWESGLFDEGSWTEAQSGWARSVVTGRARLGGIPVGVIAVETQTVMLNIPADPGAPDSAERFIPQVHGHDDKLFRDVTWRIQIKVGEKGSANVRVHVSCFLKILLLSLCKT